MEPRHLRPAPPDLVRDARVLPSHAPAGAARRALLGAPAAPVQVTLACSGADALALCLGAVLAYPVRLARAAWSPPPAARPDPRLNTLRIGTLGRAAASPAWFNTLHVYVWPALLTLAIAGYVFAWMHLAERRNTREERAARLARGCSPGLRRPVATIRPLHDRLPGPVLGRLAVLSPTAPPSSRWPASSPARRRGARPARHLTPSPSDNVLSTQRGGFLVTQECVSTPLIPGLPRGRLSPMRPAWRRRALAACSPPCRSSSASASRGSGRRAAARPRRLAVHLWSTPSTSCSSRAVVVVVAARWRHGGTRMTGCGLVGVILGAAFVHLLGPLVHGHRHALPAGAPTDDPQGAIACSFPRSRSGLYRRAVGCGLCRRRLETVPRRPGDPRAPQAAGLARCTLSRSHASLTAHRAGRPRLGARRPGTDHSPRWSTRDGRLADVGAVAALAASCRHRGHRRPGSPCAVPAHLRHGDRRAPPRPVHRDGAVPAPDRRLPGSTGSRSPISRAPCSSASRGRSRPTTGSSSSRFPLSAAAAYLLARHLALAPAGRDARGDGLRVLALPSGARRVPPAYRADRSGCRCISSRCGAAWTPPLAGRGGPVSALSIAGVTLSNFYGGFIAAVITPVAVAAYWLAAAPTPPAVDAAPGRHGGGRSPSSRPSPRCPAGRASTPSADPRGPRVQRARPVPLQREVVELPGAAGRASAARPDAPDASGPPRACASACSNSR